MPDATAKELTFEELGKLFGAMGARLTGLSFERPLRTVALYLSSQARGCFDEARAPDGTPWLPLQHPSKKRGGPTAKPLRDTGMLMASLGARAFGHVEQVSDTALVWGTNLVSEKGYPYPAVHQFGGGNVPARPFLGMTPQMEATVSRILLEWAVGQLSQAPGQGP